MVVPTLGCWGFARSAEAELVPVLPVGSLRCEGSMVSCPGMERLSVLHPWKASTRAGDVAGCELCRTKSGRCAYCKRKGASFKLEWLG